MADELNLALTLRGDPDTLRTTWRAQPPDWLREFRMVDESYESLVFERDVMTKGMKILMWGQAKTLYRITATFRPAGPGETQVTLIGQAQEAMRAEILAWADAQAATSG